MVQVDVFLTFAFGASFAAAAKNTLVREERPFRNRYFIRTLLFMGMVFSPIGVFLLAQFPGWETMFTFYPLLVQQPGAPPGTVPAFAGVIMAMVPAVYTGSGILGFYLAWRAIRRGSASGAHLLWIAGFGIVPLITLVGWDGTGWERFTFAGTWLEWERWKLQGGPNPYRWYDFFSSAQFYALLAMGALALPPAAWFYLTWPAGSLMPEGGAKGLKVMTGSSSAIMRRVMDVIIPRGGPFAPGAGDYDLIPRADEVLSTYDPMIRAIFPVFLWYVQLASIPRYGLLFTSLSDAKAVEYLRGMEESSFIHRRTVILILKLLTSLTFYEKDEVTELIGYRHGCHPLPEGKEAAQ